MRITRLHWRFDAPSHAPLVLVMGNFDGVHIGHQAILSAARTHAAQRGTALGLLSFSPHPRRYFNPDAPPFLLTPMRRQAELLAAQGVVHWFILRFDQIVQNLSRDEFADGIKHHIHFTDLFAGADFRFGHARAGDMAFLANHLAAHGVAVHPQNLVTDADAHGQVLSSSGIRAALDAGQFDHAAAMLGRQWQVGGYVRAGAGLAREWGFPTANIYVSPDMLTPPNGVYAGRVQAPNGEWLGAVANWGVRPTVNGGAKRLEVHAFGGTGDWVGSYARFEPKAFLRGEQKFDNLASLKTQITRDAEAARRIMDTHD